ncbi:Uncharacterised protein [Mycobacteroides abscessus subsp. massiliense]|uniref:hypothetical protein n=1 Tax=Mycobacteroides abscessus TaxID=36809 RepID=UPI0009A7DA73|nr:hypothetical protein [Mycobacteroides abscessus]SKT56376.1 Uncharacterised protein [Mycobacteroides abscessus subsp. massiliense]
MTILLMLWTLVVSTGLVLIVWRVAAGLLLVVQTVGIEMVRMLATSPDEDLNDSAKFLATLIYCFGQCAWLCFTILVFLWAATKPLASGQVAHELLDVVLGSVVFGALWAADKRLWPEIHKSRTPA